MMYAPEQVDRDLAEVHKIRESLCDEEPDAELSRCLEEVVSPSITLRALHERVQARLAHWRGRRAEKLAEYEAVMVREGMGGATQMGEAGAERQGGHGGQAGSGREGCTWSMGGASSLTLPRGLVAAAA